MAFNLFDFSSKLNPLGNMVPTTPKASPTQIGGATGGGMMPPTTSSKPLPQTPMVKKPITTTAPTFMEKASELIIPKASANSNKMSVDEFAEKIKTKYPQYSSLDNKELADKMVAKYPQYKEQIEVPKSSESVFKDQYADEGIVRQGLKALPRALGNVAEMTAESVGTLGQGATNLLSKGVQYATTGSTEGAMQFENPYTAIKNEIEGKVQNQLAPTSVGKDLSKVTAGGSTAAFNILKAVPAVAIQTASELPGGQYVIQAIGKGIDVTADMLASATGMDKETAQNSLVTVMNTLGLKGKSGSTAGTITKAKQAYTGASSKTMGTIKATAAVGAELGKNVKDVTLSPITAAGALKKAITKPKTGPQGSLLGTLSGVSKESIDILKENPRSGVKDGTYTIDSLKKTIEDYQNSPGMNPEKVKILERDAAKLIENKKAEIANNSMAIKNQIVEKLKENIDENTIDKRNTGTFYEQAKATPEVTTEGAIKQPYYDALKEKGIIEKPDGTMEWGGLSKASDQGKVRQAMTEINDIIGKSETPSNRPALEQLGFKFDENGRLIEMGDVSPASLSSKGISPSEVTKVIREGGIKEAPTKIITSNDVLSARQRINSLIRNLSDADTVVKSILTDMKKSLNETLYSLKPEMRELDSKYTLLSDEAFALKNALFKTDSKGNLVLRDTAYSTIDSMTKKNGIIKLDKLAEVFPELSKYIEVLKANTTKSESIKAPTIKDVTDFPTFINEMEKQVPGIKAKLTEARAFSDKLENLSKLHTKNFEGKSDITTKILENKEWLENAKEAFKEAGRTDFEKTIKIIKALEETKSYIGKYGPLKQVGVGAGLLGGISISAGIGIITVLSLLATSPRVAGWVARKSGIKEQAINSIVDKLNKGLKITPEDYKIIYGVSNIINSVDKTEERKPIKKPGAK